jgi:N-acetylmuramic acid 6-phosphate etherase
MKPPRVGAKQKLKTRLKARVKSRLDSRSSQAPQRRSSARAPAREKQLPPAQSASPAGLGQPESAEALAQLSTERRNPRSENLDLKSTTEILEIINAEDATIADAVRQAIPAIAAAVEKASASIQDGGRMIYIGAGTSGRLGVLDAAECPPTFNVSPGQILGLIAGGHSAMFKAVERAEDDRTLARRDLQRVRLDERDTVIAISASGRTPYCVSALEYARACGAAAVALVCVAASPMAAAADIAIEVVTGPEVISGSTRMKAGTAQKMVLNMLSTAAMVRGDYVFGNLMINVRQANDKLVARARHILAEAAGLDSETADKLLQTAGYDVKVAILMSRLGLPASRARERLDSSGGNLRLALTP